MREGWHVGDERVSSVVGKEKSADIQSFLERHDLPAMVLIYKEEAMLVGADGVTIDYAKLAMTLRYFAAQIEASMTPVGDEVH